jgi:predicted ATP-grasp superfamily ATP-dependent carboligase
MIPENAEHNWPPAVIAGAYQTGVLGVRCLKRRGIDAVCFDCNPSQPGFKSAHGRALLCPDPDKNSSAWLDFMIALARKSEKKPVLIPSSDQFVSAIAKQSNSLKDWFILSPGIALQGLLAEKQTQYELASKHGFPMPRTRFVHSLDEVVEFAGEAIFPCLMKPIHVREWRRLPSNHPLFGKKVSIGRTRQDLIESYRLASAANPNGILQEIIKGRDTAKRVYLSCYDSEGKRIANAMFKEYRCDPMGFGPATITEPVVDPEVDEVCHRFLRSIGYVGICEIEMKWDSRDGRVKLIEANPRLSGGGDAAPYAGVDLCWIHYLDLIGEHVQPVKPTGNDFRHVVLRADAEVALLYWKEGLISLRDILRSYRPPLAFFDLDRHDLRYSIETLLISVRSLLRGILRKRSTQIYY